MGQREGAKWLISIIGRIDKPLPLGKSGAAEVISEEINTEPQWLPLHPICSALCSLYGYTVSAILS